MEIAVLIALLVIFLIRSELVFRIRMRHINLIKSRVGRSDGSFDKLMAEHDRVSYSAQMLALTKWTYRQFYPE